MSLEHTHLANAELDLAAVEKIDGIVRAGLLEILSRCREVAFNDASLRDKLRDALSAQFHPDNQVDQFADAFTSVTLLADRNVEEATDELAMGLRRAGMRVAAE